VLVDFENVASWLTERVDFRKLFVAAMPGRPVHPEEDHLIPLYVAVGAAENEPA